MRRNRLQKVAVAVSAAALALFAVGLLIRYEFWVKPLEINRAYRMDRFQRLSDAMRGYVREYGLKLNESPFGRREAQEILAWADWYGGQARRLEAMPLSEYQPDRENRILAEFQSANEGVLSWWEQIDKAW